MHRALELIEEGYSLRKAAAEAGVNHTTLFRRWKRRKISWQSMIDNLNDQLTSYDIQPVNIPNAVQTKSASIKKSSIITDEKEVKQQGQAKKTLHLVTEEEYSKLLASSKEQSITSPPIKHYFDEKKPTENIDGQTLSILNDKSMDTSEKTQKYNQLLIRSPGFEDLKTKQYVTWKV